MSAAASVTTMARDRTLDRNVDRVLESIREAGTHGLTDEENSIKLDMLKSTASSARRCLVLAGLVLATGTKRVTIQGRRANVWTTRSGLGVVPRASTVSKAPDRLRRIKEARRLMMGFRPTLDHDQRQQVDQWLSATRGMVSH